MSKRHGSREQKRAAKHKSKRDEKRRQVARATSNNPAVRLLSAASWPLVVTLEPEQLWDVGIGSLLIARRAPGGRLVVGIYLVDVFCLGVKDAFWRDVGEAEYKAMLDKLTSHGRPQRAIAPERFAKLVYCAVDYAQSLGISPHPDFHTTRHLMDGIDPSLCTDEFEFGQNGKPCYMAGPNDSPAIAHMLAGRINAAGGHFLIPVSGSMPFDLDDDDP
ncbi:MAG TPA: hypothetical protein VNH11_06000 [Pirellulales bacterium]|nr:hypothetical protein [Pirellulales bacterium]